MSVQDPSTPFAVFRGLALYLLSVSTACAALAAWPLPSAARTAVLVVLGSAVCLAAGEAVAGAAAEVQRSWRARGRLLAAIAYASLVAVTTLVVSAVPLPAVLARVAALLAWLQPALLLLAGALGDVRLVVTNSLVLVVLAALRGGPVAAVVVVAAFVLLAAFLTAHNALVVLGAYAARRGPSVDAVFREAAAIGAPVAAGLAALMWFSPPRPWTAVQWTAGPAGELPSRVYGLLVLAGLLGAGAVGLAAQFLRRRRRTPLPAEEVVEPVGMDEEPLPEEPAAAAPPLTGRRGRIVGAYVTFLRSAARKGRPRRPDATPLEFARSLSGVAGLPRLTELFMDARYGPDEPSDESVAAADRAADEALLSLAAARPRRRSVT